MSDTAERPSERAMRLSDTTTICVTLGHNGCQDVHAARSAVRSVLGVHGSKTLGYFPHGLGWWEADDGRLFQEECDAWVCLLPTGNIPYVRQGLAHLARMFGQDAIGFLAHDHAAFPESYVSAEQ